MRCASLILRRGTAHCASSCVEPRAGEGDLSPFAVVEEMHVHVLRAVVRVVVEDRKGETSGDLVDRFEDPDG